MVTLKEFKRDITVEKQILTAMIVSDKFLQEFSGSLDSNFFENRYVRTASEWVLNYFDKHSQAPRTMIQEIVRTKVARKEIDKKQENLITDLLTELSQQIKSLDDFNDGYYIELAREYFTKQNLMLTASNVLRLAEEDEINEAFSALNNFRKIDKQITGVFNPFDNMEIDNTFDEKLVEFFRFPGMWGEYCGPLERGHLVGISGPFKRGKTWICQEAVVHSAFQRKRCLFVSLEMSKRQIKERFYKRFTNTGNGLNHVIPMFDCTWNQRNVCELKQRTNAYNEPIVNHKNETKRFRPDSFIGYKICTACRGDGTDNFHPSVWYEEIKRPEFERRNVYYKMQEFDVYKNFVRMKTFPRFDANIDDILTLIERLEDSEMFVPDVIVIDYPDILKAEEKNSTGYEKEDRTWIALAQLAAKRNALVIVPTQVSKAGQSAKQLKAEHQAKWVGKLAHVDAMFSLNQTEYEKSKGYLRFGTLAHRHKDFSGNEYVTLLQNLSLGQGCLDSEIIHPIIETDDDE